MNEIDYVFPYVDCNDQVWCKDYKETRRKLNLSTDINPIRFRKWESLKYVFRGIEKNMPWIRKIHMIVSNPEQVPKWLDTDKVHIVYHKDIIPEELLPTFNSTTIEMFLGNIDGLADKFIYANDDFYVIDSMEESDFFENNIPKLSYKTDSGQKTMFKKVEYNSQRIIADYLNIVLPDPNESFIKPPHTLTPMIKETLRVVDRFFGKNMYNSCTPFREAKNFNQYIYTYYQLLTKQYLESKRTYKYFQFKKEGYAIDKAKEIANYILEQKSQSICINDTVDFKTEEEFEYIKKIINSAFDVLFSEKSKYELEDSDFIRKDLLIKREFDKIITEFNILNEEEAKKFVYGITELVNNIRKNNTIIDDDSSDDETEAKDDYENITNTTVIIKDQNNNNITENTIVIEDNKNDYSPSEEEVKKLTKN